MKISRFKAAAVVASVVFIASACGSSSDTSGAVLRDANSVAISGDDVPTTTTLATTTTDSAPDESDTESAATATSTTSSTSTTSTIPLNDDGPDAIDDLFSAMKIFNDCLKNNGQSFIGLPVAADDGGDATDPANDPKYIEALIECAAVSQIQGAFAAAGEAAANVPNEEIEFTNRILVHWADCMKGRSWIIGELTPDARGLLGIPTDLTPPTGENFLESDDLQECREIATAEAEAEEE